MDFEDFLNELRQKQGGRIPFINDYLEDYEQTEMEAQAEAQGEVYNKAYGAMSITKAPALSRMSIHDEAFMEDYGGGAHLTFDEYAFEPYSGLVKELYKYKKEKIAPPHPSQLQFPFAATTKERVKKYNKNAIETIKNLDDDVKFDEYAYEDSKDLHYEDIDNTHQRLDDIEDKFKEAVSEISSNDSDWYAETIADMMGDYMLTKEDDAKEAFVKWVFEDM